MTSTSEGIAASVRSAVLATYAVFIASGIAFASWASRIPQVRDRLRLDPSELGLVLLAMAAGSVIAFIIRDLGEPTIAGTLLTSCGF